MKTKVSDWLGRLSAGPATLGRRGIELRLAPGWPEKDTSVSWWNRAEDTHGEVDNVTQLPTAMRSAPIRVWTPAADTLLTKATVPTRSRARILQALPYALEDQLLDDPEALHFAYVRESDGTLAVAVTQRARLDAWLDGLRAAGLRPASLCPASLSLPLYPDAWSAAFAENELWVRTGLNTGFVAAATVDPPPMLAAALREASAQSRGPQQLVVLNAPSGFDADAWRERLALPIVAETRDWREPIVAPAINLLQADFSQAAHLRQTLRPLRPAGVILAVWIAATLVMDVGEWIHLRYQHNNYTAEMNSIFRQNFPDVKAVLDPAAQMRRQIDALQSRGSGPADMLPLLTRVAPTLQQQAAQVKLQSVKYAERSLTLELTLPNYQALDQIKNAFQAASLDVEVLAANGRGNEVDGRLRVRPAGAKGGAKRPT
ncbi:MAG TPA: type II secretion system protein GspL [Burkholderiales bacterium]